MDIKRILGTTIGKITKKKTSTIQASQKKDSLNISPEAKLLSEVNKYKSVIKKEVPDVRQDKVQQAKDRLKKGFYSSQKVYDSLSENLSQFLEDE